MIVIHIGLAKAGSSRLQSVLSQLEPQLAEHDIHYPRIGLLDVDHGERWGELRQLSVPGRTVVIDSETFEISDPQTVRSQLRGQEVRVVAYLRPATSLIPILYSEYTKYGLNLLDFDQFFEQLSLDSRTSWLPASLARTWADAVGPENVRIRSLDPGVLKGGTLETDFLEFIGASGLSNTRIEGFDASPRPAWETLESLRELHGIVSRDIPEHDLRDHREVQTFARLALTEAEAAAAELGWRDPGRYLSLAQQEALVDTHNRDVDGLYKIGVDALVSSIRVEPGETREFLPSVVAIPGRERMEFMHLMAPNLLQALSQSGLQT